MADLADVEAAAYSSDDLVGETIEISGAKYTLQETVASGRKGYVWRATAASGADRAVKFASPSDFSDKPAQIELVRAAKLEPYELFAHLHAVGQVDVQGVPAVALVSDWVPGRTLESLLESDPEEISADLIRAYILGVANALGALRAHGLCHDDLNLGNVMFTDSPPGLINKGQRVKLVDLGSLKPAATHDAKRKQGIDDYRWVGFHLVALHNRSRLRTVLSPRERQFLAELGPIIQKLIDVDPTQRLADNLSLYNLIESAWERTGTPATPAIRQPFEYISADQIADDAVLLQLFANSLPWLERVNSSTTQIVTGPRGCGKSTVFRWLALRTHLNSMARSSAAEPSDQPSIAGFYVSAGVELQSRLGWIRDDDDARFLAPEILHLFNLIVIREVIKTLAFAEELKGADEELLCSLKDANRLQSYIDGEVVFDHLSLFEGVGVIRQIARHLNRHIFESHQRIVRREMGDRPRSTAATLPDFTSLVRSIVPYFLSHPIVFLVDDYSTHRVPAAVQAVLHEVVWLRSGSHTFKVSAEKNGVNLTSLDGRVAELSREFTEVDCGAVMLNAPKGPVHEFTVQLLNMRLTACRYSVDAETLLGESKWETTEAPSNLAQFIYEWSLKKGKGARPATYYGTGCIADLCSGDVAALLLIYERIFTDGNVDRGTTKPVPRNTQSNAIVAVSRQLLAQLRDFYGRGSELHAFTDHFGQFISLMLRKAKKPRGQPAEMPRIEVDGHAAAMSALRADPDASEIFDELLRRAVLIDLDPGSARREHSTSLRLHLRKIYLPAFGAALGKTQALALPPDDFVFAVKSPAEAFQLFGNRRLGSKGVQLFPDLD